MNLFCRRHARTVRRLEKKRVRKQRIERGSTVNLANLFRRQIYTHCRRQTFDMVDGLHADNGKDVRRLLEETCKSLLHGQDRLRRRS